MNRICNILTAMSIFTLGCVLAIPAMAGSSRITEGNNVKSVSKTYLFGGKGNSSSTGNVNTGVPVGTQTINPNPFNIDPEVMRRTTLEARRQAENLVNELRNGGKYTGGKKEGSMPGYNGIDDPY